MVLALVIIIVIVVSVFATIRIYSASSKPFYVGVTYGGDSVTEAQQLIDKVMNYTNLFVLQSGTLMQNQNAVEQIGDYAVSKGLNFIVYYGGDSKTANSLISMGQERWGNSFLGLYFNDEPGGEMLDKAGIYLGAVFRTPDGVVTITKPVSNSSISDSASKWVTFYTSGEIHVTTVTTVRYFPNGTAVPNGSQGLFIGNGTDVIVPTTQIDYSSTVDYYPNGTITHTLVNRTFDETGFYEENIVSFTYQPDGTVQDANGNAVTDRGNISQFEPYQQLLNQNPCQTYAKTANTFLEYHQSGLNYSRYQLAAATLFTADYALYWFDYKAGYSTVFAEFVGNESRQRHIALCRGAAETFNKDWGVIITWKYHQEPYLESGDELYDDLALAYSAGAKYVIVFNYPNIMPPYGTLTEDHFEALKQFWDTLHSNPDSFGSNPASVAYVVPADFGFGFRSATDTIWGMFPADAQAQKIYDDATALTARYGAKFDILYDEPGIINSRLRNYAVVYYYNQTIT